MGLGIQEIPPRSSFVDSVPLGYPVSAPIDTFLLNYWFEDDSGRGFDFWGIISESLPIYNLSVRGEYTVLILSHLFQYGISGQWTSAEWVVIATTTGEDIGIDNCIDKPSSISLSAYPNPFNSAVTISVYCHSRANGNPEGVPVDVFDIAGRRVAQLPAYGSESVKPLSANASSACRWQPDASLTSGVYLVRAKAEDGEVTKKIIYLK